MTLPRTAAALLLAWALLPRSVAAQDGKDFVADYVDTHAAEADSLAQHLWDLSELGYLETRSSALLAGALEDAGFHVERGVAGIPTAFVATWRSGDGPVVGFLAEYDALPGFSQDRVPVRRPLPGATAGQACGHNLFGAGSVAAAIATKAWMEKTGRHGEVRLYGTPAEEGGGGKVYMVRAGLFDGVDAVLHWHPGDSNDAGAGSSLANVSAKFRFHGIASHAALSPEKGRSALDAVESMDYMVNMMREHMPEDARIHYVITNGGAAPNVVPDFAEVYYYVRDPDPATVDSLFARVVKAARGAALGTETTVDYEIDGGVYAVLPSIALQEAVHANLERVGGVRYDAAERRFAETLRESLPPSSPPIESAADIRPFAVTEEAGAYSTDVGDVSWVVPTAGLTTATWVPGTATHSWQAVAAGGTSIGEKGMLVAAKTLAMTAVDLFTDPQLLARAKAEHDRRIPDGWAYTPLLGDRDPPLDYRKAAPARR